MIYSIRLSADEERLLEETARLTSRKRSDLVREAVASYCARLLERSSPLAPIADRIGCARSGRKDLGSRAHELYGEALRAKRKGAR